jgi:hypothetical protein
MEEKPKPRPILTTPENSCCRDHKYLPNSDTEVDNAYSNSQDLTYSSLGSPQEDKNVLEFGSKREEMKDQE